LIKEPPDKQTVKAPLSRVNLLERSATYLARETASCSFSKTSISTAIEDFTTLQTNRLLLGLAVTPLNLRGRKEN